MIHLDQYDRDYHSHAVAFLFSSSSDLLDLHSFPTRRSSDLKTSKREGSGSPLRSAKPPALPNVKNIKPRPNSLTAAPPRKDRKSTRLNSSHITISYAVFCLKKKIERPILKDYLDSK